MVDKQANNKSVIHLFITAILEYYFIKRSVKSAAASIISELLE